VAQIIWPEKDIGPRTNSCAFIFVEDPRKLVPAKGNGFQTETQSIWPAGRNSMPRQAHEKGQPMQSLYDLTLVED
jgi:hypothetical protein